MRQFLHQILWFINKNKKKFLFLFKCIISILVLIWLVQKNEFNYKNIKLGLSNLPLITLFLSLTFCQLLLGSLRLHLLMQFENTKPAIFKKVFSVMWASSFIASIAPMAIIGEVYKIKELIALDSTLNKDNSFYATVFTKIFSFFGLLLIITFASLFSKNQPQVINSLLNTVYTGSLILGIVVVFKKSIFHLLYTFINRISTYNNFLIIKNRLDSFLHYHIIFLKNNRCILAVSLISFCIQLLIQFL
jgi:hypothetical protein